MKKTKQPRFDVKRHRQQQFAKRLPNPQKLKVAQDLHGIRSETVVEAATPAVNTLPDPITTPDDTGEVTQSHETVTNQSEKYEQHSTPAPMENTDNEINLADSGFLEEVVKRDYAENPISAQQSEPTPADPTPSPAPVAGEEPKKSFFGPPKLKATAQAPVDPEVLTDQPTAPPIPTMQYQEPAISTEPGAEPLGRQVGEQVGLTTSEWAFGILENFYPEVVHFFTKIDSTFIEKADLPNNLEVELVKKIMAQNEKIKGKVKISDFHKKNILPPLQRILAKKGWENVIPDEIMLIAGLVMLAADTFFKINAIRKENRLLTKEIKHTLQTYIDARSAEQKKINAMEDQMAQMQATIAKLSQQAA